MIRRDFWLNIALNNFNCKSRIVIEDGCQIGKNLTVLVANRAIIGKNNLMGSDVHIGKGCVIEANTFVNKDVPDYSVVVGNPGKIIKVFDTKSMEWLKVKSEADIDKILKNRKEALLN